MSKVEVGSVYGRLTVRKLIPDRKNPKAECVCECGNIATPQRGALVSGKAQSCGCLRRERISAATRIHGAAKTPEYKVFMAMRERCNSPSNRHFQNYGARGIRVLWASFEDFMRDMGPRPAGAWIDRLDNDGHYGPGNCKWVAPPVNQSNKRVSRVWTINGIAYASSTEAAAKLGVHPSVIVRGCNGYTRQGRHHPPRQGWSSRLKYGEVA